jgi:hypothetical protein
MAVTSDLTRQEFPQFRELYCKLLRNDLREQLPGEALTENDALTSNEVRQLVGYASMLSTSTTTLDRAHAYEIVTRLIELRGSDKSN